MTRLFAAINSRLLPITFAQLAGLACGIIGVKLNTQLISPADFGIYGVFLTFTPLGMWVVHAGLVKFTGRHWAGADNRSDLWVKLMRAACGKLPWLAAAALVAALIMAGERWFIVLPFVFVSAAALAFGTLAQVALQADRRHWSDCSLSLVGSTTRTFVPPLLYWMAGGLPLALYGGFVTHALVFAGLGVGIVTLGLRPTATPVPGIELPTVYSSALFNLLAAASWTLMGLNRWLVAFFFGTTTAGYFTLAANVALVVPAMLGTMLTQYFQPEFFAAPHNTLAERRALARRVDQVALFFWLAALAGLSGLRLVTPWLIGRLIDPKYAMATGFILPAGCYFVAVIMGQFYHQMLLAGRRERACGPVDLWMAAGLVVGGLLAAIGGVEPLLWWLMFTPILPWLLNRPLARHYLFRSERA